MSAWDEMRQRGAGKLKRREDKITDLEKAGRYKKILEDGFSPEEWRTLYYGEPQPIHLNAGRDLIKEMDDFRWDGSRRPIRSGDYYVIDYLSEL